MKAVCITSLEELQDYEERWEDLRRACGGTVHCSYYLTRVWLEAFKQVASPRIVLIEDNGDLAGIAPFAASRYSVGGMPIRVLALVGGVERRSRLNSVAILFSSDRRDVLEEIVSNIKHLDWGKMTANNMQDTPAVQQFISKTSLIGRQEEYLPGKTFIVKVPETGDVAKTFKKKARGNTRHLLNRLEKEKVTVEFKEVDVDSIDKAVAVFVQQHIERWKNKGGSVYRNPENAEFIRQATKQALSRRAGFAYQLLLDNEVAAQLFGFLDDGLAFGFKIGMNDEFARYSPGWLMHYFAFDSFQSKRIDTYFAGTGNEAYKHWLGGNEMLLPGVKVNRGVASLLVRFAASPTFQKIDSGLGIRKRALKIQSQSD